MIREWQKTEAVLDWLEHGIPGWDSCVRQYVADGNAFHADACVPEMLHDLARYAWEKRVALEILPTSVGVQVRVGDITETEVHLEDALFETLWALAQPGWEEENDNRRREGRMP